jgi:hypothetical protein
MYPDDPAVAGRGFPRLRAGLPVVLCAAVSVALMHSGLFSFLFLIPLGYASAAYYPVLAWRSAALAVLLNGLLSLGMGLYFKTGGLGMDLLYHTVMTLGFTWIMAGGAFPRIRAMYRFIAAAIGGAAAFLCVAYVSRDSAGFTAVLRSQAEWLSSVYIASSGADAVRRSALERILTPEKVLEVISAVALRGGALASAFFLLFVNRQAALGIARIFRRRRPVQTLSSFHVPANAIWVLSLSLAAILFARFAKAAVPEILAWNLLVLCAILFLAQGGGIVLFILTRRPLPPLGRLLCNILCVVVIFSPGINTAALGLLILLGIAENWLPLRAPKQDGPASTPGL